MIGLLLGGILPFLVAAMTMTAVGRAAGRMVEEVRRQFREIPGLLRGRPGAKPDTARCVDISTRAALREMVVPGLTRGDHAGRGGLQPRDRRRWAACSRARP